MSGRLIGAIVTTIIWELGIAAFIIFALPRLGVRMYWWGLITILVVMAFLAIFLYRKGSEALSLEATHGLPSMVGMRGRTITAINPDGLVKIKGELWSARAENGAIRRGEDIVVAAEERLVLHVSRTDGGGKK